jgi:hypothetical protein
MVKRFGLGLSALTALVAAGLSFAGDAAAFGWRVPRACSVAASSSMAAHRHAALRSPHPIRGARIQIYAGDLVRLRRCRI